MPRTNPPEFAKSMTDFIIFDFEAILPHLRQSPYEKPPGKTIKSDFGIDWSLCQTIWFLNPNFLRATSMSLSQFDPGKIITDDLIN